MYAIYTSYIVNSETRLTFRQKHEITPLHKRSRHFKTNICPYFNILVNEVKNATTNKCGCVWFGFCPLKVKS
jgi:hypothetical protein